MEVEIRSPVDGRCVEVLIAAGELVDADSDVIVLDTV